MELDGLDGSEGLDGLGGLDVSCVSETMHAAISLVMLDAVWGSWFQLVDKMFFWSNGSRGSVLWWCVHLFEFGQRQPAAVSPPIKCSLNRQSGANAGDIFFFSSFGTPVTRHFGADWTRGRWIEEVQERMGIHLVW